MKILLLGGGGREHALAWKLAQSPTCAALFASPGNPGIAARAKCVALDLADHAAVLGFCKAARIDLVVIGPEGPLVDGIADSLRAGSIAVFGPSRAAAQLEGSKAFTKQLCAEFGIPTAAWERHDTLAGARAALDRFALPVVVKADGLAAGKGVTIAATRAEADAALDALFQVAEAEVVIEAFLDGEEVSLFALTDGRSVVPFGSAQDHKRIGEGDTGLNTGGMGAYSPATVLTPELERRALDEIVRPTVAAMAARGTPFVGVLYAGLMLTADGPQLIEYNARFGDPEAQALLPRFQGDLAALLYGVATGQPGQVARFSANTTLTVVLAADGYPVAPQLGGTISSLEPVGAGAIVFVAGASEDGDTLHASGGRVLAVTAIADDIVTARDRAYAALDRIDYADGYCRRDIGWREIARSNTQCQETVDR